MIEDLNKNINELYKIKGILFNEGEVKFEKSINIINSFIIFMEELKTGHKEIEENSDEEFTINEILNQIEAFIKKLKKEYGI